MDQARCQTGNIIKEFCNRNNIKIIFAPANDHRSIGLVERLIQTVKRRLGCIKLDPNQRPFNIKQSLRQISQELRICRKKATNISPFEAHFGRRGLLRKGKTEAKSQRTQTPPDSPFEEEDYETQARGQDTLDNSEDPDYDPQEDLDVQEIGAAKKPTRRSKRTTKKPEKYGHSTGPQTEYDTETSEVDSPKKKFTGVASHQPPTTTQHAPQASKEDTPHAPHAPPPTLPPGRGP